MKKILVLLLAVAFAAAGVAAQEQAAPKKEKKAKESSSTKADRWSGTIIRSNKDNSTITVGKGTVEKTVVYDANTQWTKMNKPVSDSSEFKDGTRVICLGKYDEKGRLMATRIDLRTPR